MKVGEGQDKTELEVLFHRCHMKLETLCHVLRECIMDHNCQVDKIAEWCGHQGLAV